MLGVWRGVGGALIEGAADPLQRAAGEVGLSVARRGPATRIATLRQQGCMKLLFPRHHADTALQAVAVNCSGGVAAGDCLQTAITCAAATELLLTTQAAERIYRARPGDAPACLTASIRLEAGARLAWLPQETILFDGARLRRRLRVAMAGDASLLCLESRVFGRRLHGESLRRLELSDRVEIHRDGRPVLVDALEIHGDAAAALARAAIGAGAVACAMIVLVDPDPHRHLQAVRDVLDGDAGASAWDGLLRVAIVSQDAARHRDRIAAVLSVLRDGAPLPAVWRC